MKKESHRILLIESLLILISIFFLAFGNFYNIWIYLLVLLVPFILSVILIGYRYRKERMSNDILLTLLIGIIAYYLITYILGYFIGFLKSPYSLKPLGILYNLFINIVFILIIEVMRIMILKKGKYSKKLLILSFFTFSLVELVIRFKINQVTSRGVFVETLFSSIIPVFSKNLLLSFMGFYGELFDNLIYRFLMELPMYLLPILPDLGNYVNNTFLIVLPLILLYMISKNYFADAKVKINSRKLHKHNVDGKIALTLMIIILCIITSLVSGLFRYYAVTIGSGSMTGTINKGDVVVIDQKDKEPEVQQIIAFKKQNHMLVHRVVKVQKIGDKLYYRTKGDYNKTRDNWMVEEDEIVGTYKFHFKFIGWPTVILNEWIMGGD